MKDYFKIYIYKNESDSAIYTATRASSEDGVLCEENKFPMVEMRISILKTKNDYKNRPGFEFVAIGHRPDSDIELLSVMVSELIKLASEEWDVFNKPVKLSWEDVFFNVTNEGLVVSNVWSNEIV